MNRIYQNSPVIEAICEFQFQPGQAWDSTIPGSLWAEFKGDFPNKEEKKTVGYTIEPPAPPRFDPVTLLQFMRTDRSALVQVSENALVINRLRPYQTWEEFRGLIQQQLERYHRVANPKAINNLTLRYINSLEVPITPRNEEFGLQDYCRIMPLIPAGLAFDDDKQTFVHVSQRLDIQKPSLKGVLTIQLNTGAPEKPSSFAFVLDLSFRSVASLAIKDAMVWIERAHEQIEKAFTECYTDEAKEIFKPL